LLNNEHFGLGFFRADADLRGTPALPLNPSRLGRRF